MAYDEFGNYTPDYSSGMSYMDPLAGGGMDFGGLGGGMGTDQPMPFDLGMAGGLVNPTGMEMFMPQQPEVPQQQQGGGGFFANLVKSALVGLGAGAGAQNAGQAFSAGFQGVQAQAELERKQRIQDEEIARQKEIQDAQLAMTNLQRWKLAQEIELMPDEARQQRQLFEAQLNDIYSRHGRMVGTSSDSPEEIEAWMKKFKEDGGDPTTILNAQVGDVMRYYAPNPAEYLSEDIKLPDVVLPSGQVLPGQKFKAGTPLTIFSQAANSSQEMNLRVLMDEHNFGQQKQLADINHQNQINEITYRDKLQDDKTAGDVPEVVGREITGIDAKINDLTMKSESMRRMNPEDVTPQVQTELQRTTQTLQALEQRRSALLRPYAIPSNTPTQPIPGVDPNMPFADRMNPYIQMINQRIGQIINTPAGRERIIGINPQTGKVMTEPVL